MQSVKKLQDSKQMTKEEEGILGMEIGEPVSHGLLRCCLVTDGLTDAIHTTQGGTQEGCTIWLGHTQIWGCSQQRFSGGRIDADHFRLLLIQRDRD